MTGQDAARRDWAKGALIDAAGYDVAVASIRRDPEVYWRQMSRRLGWIRAPTQIKDVSFAEADFRIRWFADGVLNVSANCLDRRLPHRALMREGAGPVRAASRASLRLLGTVGEPINPAPSARPCENLVDITSNDKAIVCHGGEFLLHPAGVKQVCLQTDLESA